MLTILLSAVAGAIIGIVIFVAIANWYVKRQTQNEGVTFEGEQKFQGNLGIKVIRGNPQ